MDGTNHGIRSIGLLAHHPRNTSLKPNSHFCSPLDIRTSFITKSCFNVLILIFNLLSDVVCKFTGAYYMEINVVRKCKVIILPVIKLWGLLVRHIIPLIS